MFKFNGLQTALHRSVTSAAFTITYGTEKILFINVTKSVEDWSLSQIKRSVCSRFPNSQLMLMCILLLAFAI